MAKPKDKPKDPTLDDLIDFDGIEKAHEAHRKFANDQNATYHRQYVLRPGLEAMSKTFQNSLEKALGKEGLTKEQLSKISVYDKEDVIKRALSEAILAYIKKVSPRKGSHVEQGLPKTKDGKVDHKTAFEILYQHFENDVYGQEAGQSRDGQVRRLQSLLAMARSKKATLGQLAEFMDNNLPQYAQSAWQKIEGRHFSKTVGQYDGAHLAEYILKHKALSSKYDLADRAQFAQLDLADPMTHHELYKHLVHGEAEMPSPENYGLKPKEEKKPAKK